MLPSWFCSIFAMDPVCRPGGGGGVLYVGLCPDTGSARLLLLSYEVRKKKQAGGQLTPEVACLGQSAVDL